MKRICRVLIPGLWLLFVAAAWSQVTPPERYLNFRVGDDRKLADWNQITGYFKKLDGESDRVQVVQIGTSSMGRPMIMAIISSPDNLRRQAEIRQAMKKLADPRLLKNDAEREALLRSMPAVVLFSCSIHSTEIAASQFSMEFAYRLATAQDEDTRMILDNVVSLLIPSPNPDGIDIVVDWYRKSLGKPHEGLGPPQLYHKYAGHDNNRDWYMLNLVETRAVTRVLYEEWFPQIVYDLHQMGRSSARMVIPPFYEVTNPLIDPIILREIMMIGGHMAASLSVAGKKGIATESIYDMWWHGGFRTAPYFHNMVGLLTEAASARLATPDTVKPEELRGARRGLGDVKSFQTNLPEPWTGGVWRLRDIIDLEHITTRSVLELASRHRRMWLENVTIMAQRALEKGRTEAPAAYIVPVDQHDPASARKMLEILLAQGVEVHRAEKAFVADGHEYPAGTFIISCEQPYRANVIGLLDRQFYPERRLYPGGPLENPYDVTGWTLPLQMGVDVIRVENHFAFDGKPVRAVRTWNVTQEIDPGARYFVLDSGSNDAYRAVNRLLQAGIEVMWNTEPIATGSQVFPAGRFLVENGRGTLNRLRQALEGLSVDVQSLQQSGPVPVLSLKTPRVGLYRGHVPNMDEGWTRYVLEDFEFPYESVDDARLRAGRLNDRYDALILPSMRDSTIIRGFEYRPDNRTYPRELCGGIGEIGVHNLQSFVENGGTLLCFGEACDLAIKSFWLKSRNVVARRRGFSAPGSLLRVLVDTNHPVAYGMPRLAAIFFNNNAVLSLMEGKRVVTYPLTNPLLSGWLQGDSLIQGETAMAVVPYGSGHIVLYAFRPQHRAQTHGTYKLVFNALYWSRSLESRIGPVASSEE